MWCKSSILNYFLQAGNILLSKNARQLFFTFFRKHHNSLNHNILYKTHGEENISIKITGVWQ